MPLYKEWKDSLPDPSLGLQMHHALQLVAEKHHYFEPFSRLFMPISKEVLSAAKIIHRSPHHPMIGLGSGAYGNWGNLQYYNHPVLEEYKDYLIISRKPLRTEWNDFVENQYKHVMSQFDKKLFVSFNGKDYEDFPLKDQVDLLIVEELYDFIKIVNSCKLFLANCSGPLCFASALNANRIGEVGSWVTGRYRDDYRFSDKSEIFDDKGNFYSPHAKYLKRDFK
jgi:hypothetical protein